MPVEWGDPANPRVLVCVHGLTRQGRARVPPETTLACRNCKSEFTAAAGVEAHDTHALPTNRR